MPTFRFTGIYGSYVSLPDQSVILVEPGDVVDLPFDDPGPLWEAAAPVKTPAAKLPAVPATPPVPVDPTPAAPAATEGETS